MRRIGAVAAVVLAGFVVAGIESPPDGKGDRPDRISASASLVRAEWKTELVRGAKERPLLRFANLPQGEFSRRLHRAAARYNFEVVSVDMLRPRQVAPLVVIRSVDPLALVRDVPAVLSSIDPQVPAAGGDHRGWAYEGFFFEVRDGGGRPAIIVRNWWRSASGGGGVWATSEWLLPFEHTGFLTL